MLLIAGCASLPAGPTADAGVALPQQWSARPAAPGQATPLTDWWRRFDDALLSDLVAQAVRNNTDVESAQARLRQARAARDVAAAGLWPSLNASLSAQGNHPSAATSNRFGAGLDASWELDLFGATRHGVAASEADVRASEATLGATQVSIAAETAIAYLELRGAQTRLAIARDNLASQQETLQITQWRTQAGLASSVDEEQSRAAVAQTEAQLPQLAASIAQSQHSLSVLTGQAPAALQPRLDPAGPIPQPSAELTLAIPAQVLRQRPDVQAAELAAEAAASRVAQAGAQRLPDASLRASVAWNALTLGSLGGSGAAAALIASLGAPLFDGGLRSAQWQAQQAQFEAAQAAYRASVLTALQEVEDTLAALSGARQRVAALQRAADAANNAALLARDRYTSGLADFQTVLETQRTLLGTQDSLASTQTDLAAQHVRLYKALGGGWTSAAIPSLVSKERP